MQNQSTVRRTVCRRQQGNMLVLSGVFMTSGAIAIILGLSFAGLLFAYNRMQTTADELAITGARKLNELDRIGQLNNAIARSRQQVFAGRKQSEEAELHFSHLTELAGILLEEARDGAHELEQQRQHVRALNQSEVQTAVMDKFNQLKSRHTLVLPWIRTEIALNPVIRFGYIDRVESNVGMLDGLDELKEIDQAASISDSQSDLYQDNINPKLEGSDGDLDFKLCSLPAPVDNNVAPARATLADAFRESPGNHMQSAVQIEIDLDVQTMLGAGGGGKVHSIGTGLATGANPMQ